MSNKVDNQQQKKSKTFFRSNPVMNGLNKVNERVADDSSSASYGGIALKTTYFILMAVVGIMIYLVLNKLVFTDPANMSGAFLIEYENFYFQITPLECFVLGGNVILGIVCQLLACLVGSTIPVTGTVFSITEGFFVSFTIFKILKGYEYIGMLALVATVLVVLIMNILYSKQIIKADAKFRMVMLTLFITVIAASILITLSYFIPFARPVVMQMMANPAISIGFTVISIIIAALFLISDFAMIDTVVQQRYPKKYEWRASFGLAFTIIWLYVKILDLLIQVIGNSHR